MSRVLTVPLVHPEPKRWKELFDLARESARYANSEMAERFARAVGVLPGKPEPTAFVRWGDKLSSVVRLGAGRHVQGAWARSGRKIVAGVERCAMFDAYRALTFQVHESGGRLDRDPDGFVLRLKALPGSAPHEELALYMPGVARDPYATKTLDQVASGEWPLKQVRIVFKRGSRRLKAQLAYRRPKAEVEPGSLAATLSLEEDGARLVLRCNGRELHLTDHLHRLRAMKAHFAGIHDRLRASLGKARRYHDARRALLRSGNFEAWAASPIHELSARIIKWATAQCAGKIVVAVGEGGDLPWHRLIEQLKYKGAESGIVEIARAARNNEDAEEIREPHGTAVKGESQPGGRSKRPRKAKMARGDGLRSHAVSGETGKE